MVKNIPATDCEELRRALTYLTKKGGFESWTICQTLAEENITDKEAYEVLGYLEDRLHRTHLDVVAGAQCYEELREAVEALAPLRRTLYTHLIGFTPGKKCPQRFVLLSVEIGTQPTGR